MPGRVTGIDHAAVVVADMDAASASWTAAGFALTTLARHEGADGQPTGTGNRCAMLRSGYIELLGVIDPARPSRTIAGMLARYEGVHILSLATDDIAAAQARLARAGFDVAITATARPTDGGLARFERLPLAALVPRLQLIRHLTPELVWIEADLHHPNHAVALDELVIAADPSATLAADLSRAAGRPVRPDRREGFVLDLPAGRVRVLTPDAVRAEFPGVVLPALPFVAGLVLRTDDANVAVTALAIGAPVGGDRMVMVGGTAVLFRPG
ncbi:MAG: VOC family protein [Alphaproteobacteria bacterium]|nr:VOC family protein [Alphaproteobacteria bacterium]